MSASFATAERLGPNTGLTPESFYVAANVPIARTGAMQYRCSEIGIPGGDKLVTVWRLAEDVFSRVSMASGEGKPLVSPHPGRFVSPENWASVTRGHIQNLRPGTEPLADGNIPLLADLFVGDGSLIEQIKLGLKEVSLGYDCAYDGPFEDGSYRQRNIIINHAALVPAGRAQNTRIQDSAEGGAMDISDLEARFDVLLQLMKRIIPGAAKITDQRKPTTDGRVLTFDELRDQEDERYRQSNFAYGEACNSVGRQMRAGIPARDCRPALTEKRRATDRAVEEDAFSWADDYREAGRKMREERK
jgi:hypothetical protein